MRETKEERASELCVQVTVVSAAGQVLAGLQEDALHGLPQAVLAGARHGVNFPLATDRPPVLLPRHRQQRIGGFVAEADGLLALPHGSSALDRPLVQVVSFPFVAKCTHLLWTRDRRETIYDGLFRRRQYLCFAFNLRLLPDFYVVEN